MNIDDIVRFNESATHDAAVFCRSKGITGKIIRKEAEMLVIDASLGYEVFAKPDQLTVVCTRQEIPSPIDVET